MGTNRSALLVAFVLFIVSACTAAPTPSRPSGPSPLITGFQPARVAAAVNALANGPRCLSVPDTLSSSSEPADSTRLGMTIAGLTIKCTDPGDGSALARAWSAGVASELSRLQAAVRMTGTGDGITDEWGYSSGGLAGDLSFDVLDAGGGQYWVVTRIFEPFAG